MKTYLSIIAIIFFCSFSRAQSDEDYERQFRLQKVWVNTNEQAWTFSNNQAEIENRYVEWYYRLQGDTLDLWFYDEYNYDGENSDEPINHSFRVCKLTNDELVLHPLNADAIWLFDNRFEDDVHKAYFKEIKAAGKDVKKRNSVISRYKTNLDYYVDTLKFASRAFYFEAVTIDSVDVSLTWTELDGDKNIERTQFNDLRWVPATNTYYFGYRFKDEKIPEYMEGEGLRFIPPVIVDREIEESVQHDETAQDSLMRILDEAPAGWYTGKFDETGMLLLETALYMYGLNKPHNPGIKEDCDYSVRVYHEGKYTDFYHTNGEMFDMSYLQQNFFEFLDSWMLYVRTFEECKSKTIVFPIALKK